MQHHNVCTKCSTHGKEFLPSRPTHNISFQFPSNKFNLLNTHLKLKKSGVLVCIFNYFTKFQLFINKNLTASQLVVAFTINLSESG